MASDKPETPCAAGDCYRAIAPNDGRYCSLHSKKLALPGSIKDLGLPQSALVAKRGINTSVDFANFMGALMGDVVEGKVDPKTANAACQAGHALLKIVEMRLRHGFKGEALQLTEAADGIADPPQFKLGTEKSKAVAK